MTSKLIRPQTPRSSDCTYKSTNNNQLKRILMILIALKSCRTTKIYLTCCRTERSRLAAESSLKSRPRSAAIIEFLAHYYKVRRFCEQTEAHVLKTMLWVRWLQKDNRKVGLKCRKTPKIPFRSGYFSTRRQTLVFLTLPRVYGFSNLSVKSPVAMTIFPASTTYRKENKSEQKQTNSSSSAI